MNQYYHNFDFVFVAEKRPFKGRDQEPLPFSIQQPYVPAVPFHHFSVNAAQIIRTFPEMQPRDAYYTIDI
jgi:hypothetical protein